jgi:hypothetical protein
VLATSAATALSHRVAKPAVLPIPAPSPALSKPPD